MHQHTAAMISNTLITRESHPCLYALLEKANASVKWPVGMDPVENQRARHRLYHQRKAIATAVRRLAKVLPTDKQIAAFSFAGVRFDPVAGWIVETTDIMELRPRVAHFLKALMKVQRKALLPKKRRYRRRPKVIVPKEPRYWGVQDLKSLDAAQRANGIPSWRDPAPVAVKMGKPGVDMDGRFVLTFNFYGAEFYAAMEADDFGRVKCLGLRLEKDKAVKLQKTHPHTRRPL